MADQPLILNTLRRSAGRGQRNIAGRDGESRSAVVQNRDTHPERLEQPVEAFLTDELY